MAKSTTGKSRFKIQRALDVELPGLGKRGALERRPYPPGQHGQRRRKISDYAVRLKEKQKLRFHYGLREKQIVNYVKQAKRVKTRAWMDTLIITLESRLNNAVFRLNFASSMPAASQIIRHGHVLVNGKKVTVGGYQLKKGDVITLTEKGYGTGIYLQAQTRHPIGTVPACFQVEDKKKGTLVELPIPGDIPFPFEKQLVTEHYGKIKA